MRREEERARADRTRAIAGIVVAIGVAALLLSGCEEGGTNALFLELEQWQAPEIVLVWDVTSGQEWPGDAPSSGNLLPGESGTIRVATNPDYQQQPSIGFASLSGRAYNEESGQWESAITVTSIELVGPEEKLDYTIDLERSDANAFSDTAAGIEAESSLADGESESLSITVESNDASDPTADFDLTFVGDANLNDPRTRVLAGAGGGPRMELLSLTVEEIPGLSLDGRSTPSLPAIAALANGESVTLTASLENSGDTVLLLENAGGDDPFVFNQDGSIESGTDSRATLTYPDGPIAVGETFEVSVTYTSGSIAAEVLTFYLIPDTYALSGGNEPWTAIQAEVELTGATPAGHPLIVVDGMSSDYTPELGTIEVGEPTEFPVTIYNVGGATLEISSLSVTYPDTFSLDDTGSATIPAGGSRSYVLTAEPDAAETLGTTITVSYGTGDSETMYVTVVAVDP